MLALDSLAFLVVKVIDFKGSERTRESIFSAEPKSGYTPMGARYTWRWYIELDSLVVLFSAAQKT